MTTVKTPESSVSTATESSKTEATIGAFLTTTSSQCTRRRTRFACPGMILTALLGCTLAIDRFGCLLRTQNLLSVAE